MVDLDFHIAWSLMYSHLGMAVLQQRRLNRVPHRIVMPVSRHALLQVVNVGKWISFLHPKHWMDHIEEPKLHNVSVDALDYYLVCLRSLPGCVGSVVWNVLLHVDYHLPLGGAQRNAKQLGIESGVWFLQVAIT